LSSRLFIFITKIKGYLDKYKVKSSMLFLRN
jgi:hypothetical protein